MPFTGAGPRDPRGLALSLTVATAIIVSLARVLPADTFFTGDSGVKLVAARSALAHPSHPFDIDVPVVRGTPMADLMDGFFAPHGDHAHAVTSPLFPVLTAPLLGLFGLRGLFVLPVVGLLAALLGLALTAQRLDETTTGGPVFWIALITTPLLFYGLEFWEHSLAAGAAYLATALFIGTTGSTRQPMAAGVLIGAATLMRPESLCYALALVVADRTLPQPARLRDLVRVAGGAGAAMAPMLAYNALHLGAFLGPHMGGNVAPFAVGWVHWRWTYVQAWLWPGHPAIAVVVVTAAVAALVALATRTRDALVRVIVIAASGVLAVLAARRAFPLDSLWAVCPAALLLLAPRTRHPGDRFARVLVAMDVLLVVAASPNDGGAQWGPRYLLLATGPAALVAWWSFREVWQRCRTAEIALAAVLIVASAAVQRQAFKELKAIKQAYGRLQTTVGEMVHDEVVLSDVWWFDQVAGAHAPPPTFLFAAREGWPDVALRLERAGVLTFAVVTPTPDTAAPQLQAGLSGTSFRVRQRHDIDGALTIYAVGRGVGPQQ